MSFDPQQLVAGALVRLPGQPDHETVVHVRQGAFWEFGLESRGGRYRRISLPEAELPGIEVVSTGRDSSFDADPRAFRLGIEARRIRSRFQDDMGALAVSSIDPLPHQLEAVYGKLLQEPRLRFLLADDPGAGKTIMTGLYIKELQLRDVADRVLIVAPANLSFQWQRELDERFQIPARRITRETLESDPMTNPWEQDGVFIVSRDLLKTKSMLDSFTAAQRPWDLAVLDEAHGYTLKVKSSGAIDSRTDRYKAAERVASRADRLLLLTATPHSGREESIWALMRLLDSDAYGDRCPDLVEIMPHHYSRTTKEQMVDLRGRPLFRPRVAHTVTYDLDGAEWDLYQQVSYFITQGLAQIRREQAEGGAPSVSGFALTTMQRRLASSIRAITRTLARRVERLERELEQPDTGRSGRFTDVDPDSNSDRPEDEKWDIEEQALDQVPGFRSREELEAELELLRPLLIRAQETERLDTETKFGELWTILETYGVGDDPSKKLLIFTEHRDTLDFLVEKLRTRFTVATIHGKMRPAERVAAERAFRETAQIMVATEAAGEGINLQFCHLMVNYDIPWNPNRLEQRMGRIHRIGQTEDVHIFNFVAANTKEGRVLATVLGKLEAMRRNELLGDQIFDVVGEILSGYRLRDLLESVISEQRTPSEVLAVLGADNGRFDERIIARMQELSEKALATGHIDWQLHRRATGRAEERRLAPGYLARFFLDAVDYLGGRAEERLDRASLRVVSTPDILIARDRDRGGVRQLQPRYERITFDKGVATNPVAQDAEVGAPRPELCGPGHVLFDALLEYLTERTDQDLERGAVFHDSTLDGPALLHVLEGQVLDGHGSTVHRGMACVLEHDGQFQTIGGVLYDLALGAGAADIGAPPQLPVESLTDWARANVYEEQVRQVLARHERTADIQEDFLHASFSTLLARIDMELLAIEAEVDNGVNGAGGRLRRTLIQRRTAEERRDRRIADTVRTRVIDRGPVTLVAQALMLPGQGHDWSSPADGAVRDVVDVARRVAIDHENDCGTEDLRQADAEGLGFDLVSERPDGTRYIQVKGQAGIGDIEMTWSEYIAAQKFGRMYWLYVVLDCATPTPRMYCVRDPATTLAGNIQPTRDVRYSVPLGVVVDRAHDETEDTSCDAR
ncbi:helicase-related protein [Nocardia yamanashiensis]|uniref:helicase-related protein n=1 Tax=Nocardia yamanashiensis TaxID=209247 RepID=UPI0008365B7D|nr:helicase-related protein [Nocardia yamanashiensis]